MLDNLFSNLDGDIRKLEEENLIEYRDQSSNVFLVSYSLKRNAIKIKHNSDLITINFNRHFAYREDLDKHTCNNIWQKDYENYSISSIIKNYQIFSYLILPNSINNTVEYVLDDTIVKFLLINILSRLQIDDKLNKNHIKNDLEIENMKDYKDRSREYADNKFQKKLNYIKLINNSDDDRNRSIIIKMVEYEFELNATYKNYDDSEDYKPFDKSKCSLN